MCSSDLPFPLSSPLPMDRTKISSWRTKKDILNFFYMRKIILLYLIYQLIPNHKYILWDHWAQKLIIYPYIGPMAQAENEDLPEEEKSSSKEIVLINKRWVLVIIALNNVPRMKISLAGLGRGPRRWFNSKYDNP